MALKKAGPQATAGSAPGPQAKRPVATRAARGTTARARAGTADAVSAGPQAPDPRETTGSGAATTAGEAVAAGPEVTTSADEDRPGHVPVTGDASGRPSGRRPSPVGETGRDGSGYQRGGCEVWPD